MEARNLMGELHYSEPESVSPEEIRERLLELDRGVRLDFMLLTLEPFDPADERRRRSDRRRLHFGTPRGKSDRRACERRVA